MTTQAFSLLEKKVLGLPKKRREAICNKLLETLSPIPCKAMIGDLETLCDALDSGKVKTHSNKATWDYLDKDLKSYKSRK